MANVTVRKGDLFTFKEKEGEVVAIVNTGSGDVDYWSLLPGQFNKRFGVNRFIKSQRRGQDSEIYYQKGVVDAYTGKKRNVITMIVKRHEGEPVDLNNLNSLLWKLRAFCKANGIQKLVMPKLCCGVHGCDWNNVGNLLRGVFNGSGIKVVVYHID
jgi:hypothetical protein